MLATEDTSFTNEIILSVPYQSNHYKTLTSQLNTAATIVQNIASTGAH